MKRFIFALIFIFLYYFSGCGKTEVNDISVGKLVSISAVSTSFNECSKSEIKTTKGTFIIQGYASGIHGIPVFIRKTKNGHASSQYLFIGEDAYRLFRGI